jgi:hypothetical protein
LAQFGGLVALVEAIRPHESDFEPWRFALKPTEAKEVWKNPKYVKLFFVSLFKKVLAPQIQCPYSLSEFLVNSNVCASFNFICCSWESNPEKIGRELQHNKFLSMEVFFFLCSLVISLFCVTRKP